MFVRGGDDGISGGIVIVRLLRLHVLRDVCMGI